MRALTSGQNEALNSRAVMRRTFVWLEPKIMGTDTPEPIGFWDDVGSVTLDDGRIFHGDGTLVGVSTLSFASNLTVPGLVVTLGGTSEAVEAAIRGYDPAQAPVEVLFGIFDVALRALINDPIRVFRGYVDDVTVKTPAAGGASIIELTCESMSRQLTVRRTGTRSPATQAERDPLDRFYDYTATQREQPIYFGMKSPRG